MSPFEQSLFELSLRLAFHEKRGDEFQVFFSQLMGFRYPTDFIATRPWGQLGDRKCDGYLKSTRTLFQCFAPNELELSVTLKKMEEDFVGAMPHRTEFFDSWVFVHNAPDERLATDIARKLVELEGKAPGLKTQAWGFSALRKMALQLDASDLRSLLPRMPTPTTFAELTLKDVKPILEHLIATGIPDEGAVMSPPPGKIEHNSLSDASARYLKMGMARARLVGRFLASNADKTYGDRLAGLFHAHYLDLRRQNLDPDDVLVRLFHFATGPLPTGNLRADAAAWTVLAYLFEHCDIFETPPALIKAL